MLISSTNIRLRTIVCSSDVMEVENMYRIYIALIMFFLQPFISSLLWEMVL